MDNKPLSEKLKQYIEMADIIKGCVEDGHFFCDEIDDNQKHISDMMTTIEELFNEIKQELSETEDLMIVLTSRLNQAEKEITTIKLSYSDLDAEESPDDFYEQSVDGAIALWNDGDDHLFLYFEGVSLDAFYYDYLTSNKWKFDEEEEQWINSDNLINRILAISLIRGYEFGQPDIDKPSDIDYGDDIEIENVYIASKNKQIELFSHEDDPTCLCLYFGKKWLDYFFKDYLENNSWKYDTSEDWWISENSSENNEFAISLIAFYDSGIREHFGIISDDHRVQISNTDEPEEIRLYFDHGYLDNYYWNLLTDNDWSYDNVTQAWYHPFDYYGYVFFLDFAKQYNDDPPVIPVQESDEDNTDDSASGEGGTFDDNGLSLQSALNKMGYTVNQKDDLSDLERQRILKQAIESGTYSKKSIISFLEWNISLSKRRRSMETAISKWKRDIDYIKRHF